jgi:hypothetical protein
MLFERRHTSRRIELPDDPVREISSQNSIKASSILYSWYQRYIDVSTQLSNLVSLNGLLRDVLETPPGAVSKLKSKHQHVAPGQRMLLPSGSFWLHH